MRQRTFIIGIVFIVFVSTATLFKILRLPGAPMMLAFTAVSILAFTIFYLIDKISLERNQDAKISVVVLSFATLLMILSPIFKLLHWPGNEILGYFSIIIFSVYIVFFT